jgi:hypothetical protein
MEVQNLLKKMEKNNKKIEQFNTGVEINFNNINIIKDCNNINAENEIKSIYDCFSPKVRQKFINILVNKIRFQHRDKSFPTWCESTSRWIPEGFKQVDGELIMKDKKPLKISALTESERDQSERHFSITFTDENGHRSTEDLSTLGEVKSSVEYLIDKSNSLNITKDNEGDIFLNDLSKRDLNSHELYYIRNKDLLLNLKIAGGFISLNLSFTNSDNKKMTTNLLHIISIFFPNKKLPVYKNSTSKRYEIISYLRGKIIDRINYLLEIDNQKLEALYNVKFATCPREECRVNFCGLLSYKNCISCNIDMCMICGNIDHDGYECGLTPEEKTEQLFMSTILTNRRCPQCDIMTTRTGGCAHIQCVYEECKNNWCWECGYSQPNPDDWVGCRNNNCEGYLRPGWMGKGRN